MANTNKDVKFFVSEGAQPDDLTEAEFEALTWVQVGQVGNVGDRGTQTNILTYPTLDTEVAQKAKGISNAGDPTVEVARKYDDAGQIILDAQAETNFNYAFKEERNDAPDASTTHTVYYYRGLVLGPSRPGGGNEDFDRVVYTLGLQQKEIRVNPEAIP